MIREMNTIAMLVDRQSRVPFRASSLSPECQRGGAMKSRKAIHFLILCTIVLVASACVGFTYSSTGRAWTVRAEETIKSDTIRARRTITFQASGQLEAGTVTASVYRDSVVVGAANRNPGRGCRAERRIRFREGLWSFHAQADKAARGELYLSISDE